MKEITIKRYANRKLYNMEESSYVTLEDLRDYVVRDVPFKVTDNRTKNDVTAKHLLEVLKREDSDIVHVDDTEILKAIIRTGRGFLSYVNNTPTV